MVGFVMPQVLLVDENCGKRIRSSLRAIRFQLLQLRRELTFTVDFSSVVRAARRSAPTGIKKLP